MPFTEAVVQRRAGVAHMLSQLLATVDVTEGDVVHTVEGKQGHDIETALLDIALEVRGGLDAGREAVRDRHRPSAAGGVVDADDVHRTAKRIGLRTHPGPHRTHERGFEVRDAVEVHRTVLVRHRDRLADRRRVGAHVDAVAQQRRLEAEPRRGGVVAAGDDDLRAGVGQCPQRLGQQRVAGGGRRRGIEDVARHDDHVDRVGADLFGERLEHTPQRIERRMTVEGPPDVPVGGMQDAHGSTVGAAADIARKARGWAQSWAALRRAPRSMTPSSSAMPRKTPTATMP